MRRLWIGYVVLTLLGVAVGLDLLGWPGQAPSGDALADSESASEVIERPTRRGSTSGPPAAPPQTHTISLPDGDEVTMNVAPAGHDHHGPSAGEIAAMEAAEAREWSSVVEPFEPAEVDPTDEGFESLEEMEHFVREQLQLPPEVSLEFSRVIEDGRARLRISLRPPA